jgi:hypothetical protein
MLPGVLQPDGTAASPGEQPCTLVLGLRVPPDHLQDQLFARLTPSGSDPGRVSPGLVRLGYLEAPAVRETLDERWQPRHPFLATVAFSRFYEVAGHYETVHADYFLPGKGKL